MFDENEIPSEFSEAGVGRHDHSYIPFPLLLLPSWWTESSGKRLAAGHRRFYSWHGRGKELHSSHGVRLPLHRKETTPFLLFLLHLLNSSSSSSFPPLPSGWLRSSSSLWLCLTQLPLDIPFASFPCLNSSRKESASYSQRNHSLGPSSHQ